MKAANIPTHGRLSFREVLFIMVLFQSIVEDGSQPVVPQTNSHAVQITASKSQVCTGNIFSRKSECLFWLTEIIKCIKIVSYFFLIAA